MNSNEKLQARIDELVRIADSEYDRRVKAEAELASRDARINEMNPDEFNRVEVSDEDI